ncbi:telomerase reverse transcriptase isoform X1 [Tribolium castaneum]|uniref:telomerase reverse transcriptase isoform X1 n=1 Tax=Tribolium castaneum TaxID=7070 RepID=UPI0030FF204E
MYYKRATTNKIMVHYYRLSLKSRQKAPKTVNSKYHSILNIALKNFRLCKKHKTKKPVQILTLLQEIIPKSYFGTTTNLKRFYKVVEKILTQSSFECIHLSVLHKCYDYDAIPWLQNVEPNLRPKLLLKHNLFLLDNIVKPLIAFYYKPIKTLNGHEIKFIRKEEYISFESKVFHKLKKMKYLVEVQDEVKPRGVLNIIPKQDNFRAIVSIFPDSARKPFFKLLTSKIYKVLEEKYKTSGSLYTCWSEFTQKTQGQIYGIKVDIRDAYGNVKIPVLCKLIQSIPTHLLDSEKKNFIVDHISNQFVAFRRKIYKWNHGLLQGDPLSGCLCELYMAFMDRLYFSNLDKDAFIHRTVDDYFFCSPHPHKVYDFELLIKGVYQVNPTKTRTNLPTHRHPQDEIPYCGKIFNLTTRQVRTLYKLPPNYEIRHKFKLWNFNNQISDDNPARFLQKAMDFPFICNSFTKFEFNTVFNDQKTVFANFYDAMICVAYKFDAAMMALRTSFLVNDFGFIWLVLSSTVRAYASRAFKKIVTYKGGKYRKVTFQCLKSIAWRAFLAVLKRRTEIYKGLIDRIKSREKLTMKFHDGEVDASYFCKLPEKFRFVKINRKASI